MDVKFFEEERIYSSDMHKLNETNYNVIRTAIRNNHATGFIAGYYDEQLTIATVSEFFLHNLTYTYEGFMQATQGSLKNLIYDQKQLLSSMDFQKIHGEYQCQILAKNNQPITVRLYKLDTLDKDGTRLWVMSTNIDMRQQQLQLTNKELSAQNEAMTQLIRSATRLIDRYAMCDLLHDSYTYYSCLANESPYQSSGSYRELIQTAARSYKLLNRDITLLQALSPNYIRARMATPDDMYKIEYCSFDEKEFRTLAIAPLAWEKGKVARVMLIVQNTTQEKLAEIRAREALREAYLAANKASEAKTTFLSNMSHDIRTPMNAIVGMTAIAGVNIDDKAKVLDCLEKITQSSQHLLTLINEVLDMSRIESGKISLAEDRFNLRALTDTMINLANTSIEAHQHQFSVNLENLTHADVYGDSLRLQQLLTNILTNSIKYTPAHGRISFSISELPIDEKDLGCYQFIIKDNGVGMSEDFQKIMFEPFTRANNSTTNKIFGTGLGMSIAKNIVSLMNGDIKVESAPGRGSTFTITLFLKILNKSGQAAQQTPMQPANSLAEMKRCDYSGKRILLVEDNKLNREIACEIISMTGAQVFTAVNGKDAVERYTAAEPGFFDLIFMDVQMPIMTGYEATAAIRSSSKSDALTIPIIAMTANAFTEDVLMAKNAGMNEHMAKPIDMHKLRSVLAHWL